MQLEEVLHDNIANADQKSRIAVVYGIGGAGKTQLALDYVQRHRHDYSAIFWIEASSRESIERDYVQIYILLYDLHVEAAHAEIQVEKAVLAVKRWFYGRGKRWLFVVDSADTISNPDDPLYIDLRRFLPDDPSIHTIVTTRDQSAQDMTELPAVEVDEMTSEEAIALFQKQARLRNVTPQQEEQISTIVQELGHLALAITLAGSYVATTPRLRGDLSRYLPEYQNRRRELLAQRPSQLVHRYGESVLTTWETSFRAIEAQNKETCHFLALLSFFSHDDIPVDFPTTSSDDGKPPLWVATLFSKKHITQYDIEAFFRTLVGFSLVRYRDEQDSYAMHSLVQVWAYDRLTNNQQRHYSYVCALLLQDMTELMQNANPLIRGRLVTHVMNSFYMISQSFQSIPSDAETLLDSLRALTKFLDLCGRFQYAAIVERFIYRTCLSSYGDKGHETLWSMTNLSMSLRKLGETQEALSMAQTGLEQYLQTLGKDHPETLTTMGVLASILIDAGKVHEALTMRRSVLEKCQQILGEDHPDTLKSMQNLAISLEDTGEIQEALSLERTILMKRQQMLGEDHPDSLDIRENLALSLLRVGNIQEAIMIERSVLEKRQRIQGEDHPDTLTSMHDLAISLDNMGNGQEALTIMQTVFKKRQQILGENHPNTLRSMHSLAICLGGLGQTNEAMEIEQAVLNKRQRILGENHPDTLMTMHSLAMSLDNIGEQQDAIRMARAVVEKRQQVLGNYHPDSLLSMQNLAIFLNDTEETQEALEIQREVVKERSRLFGAEHPLTATSCSLLAEIEEKSNTDGTASDTA